MALDALNGTAMIGGAAVVTMIAGFWSQLKLLLGNIRGLFIVRVRMTGAIVPCVHQLLRADDLTAEGEGDTADQFQSRCTRVALKLFWENANREIKEKTHEHHAMLDVQQRIA